MQEDNHIFQGLKRDNHQIKQDGKFLWDAHNIRITNREDNTLFSITNEKGTSNALATLPGKYVGHCVLGKYLVVFAKGVIADYIYRIERDSTGYRAVTLFKGSLGFSTQHPIETIGDYEGELIQKVYWVDGINQPRVINIVKPELDGIESPSEDMSSHYNIKSFDFIQSLTLNEKIEIKKNFGEGMFAPGVIQYAFSYYNKYGQESNIFYTTPLNYISPQDRGGSPEETIANSFSIKVSNVDNNFEYLRIYSIHRTSIDAVPTVLRVRDLPIGDNSTLEFTDTGTTGDTVDPQKLLYIGGEEIYAGTICSKDGTLFLGDIKIIRPPLFEAEVKEEIKQLPISTDLLKETVIDESTSSSSDGYYRHYHNLSTMPGFKSGETYRIGVQFQHESGKWSDPMVIKDEAIPSSTRPLSDSNSYSRPIFKFNLNDSIISYAKDKNYKKVRALIVPPSVQDREILAQGMLCPTVFNVESRRSNTPFSQASWFLRPNLPTDVSNWSNNNSILEGAYVEFRHLHSLFSGSDRGAEIQCNSSTPTFSNVNTSVDEGRDSYSDVYMIDQSILTFHSPEIEWDTRVAQSINGQPLKLRIVGLINFTSNIGDIDISTSTPAIGKDSPGFVHRSLGCTTSGGKSLVSGLFYRDYLVDDKDQNSSGFQQYSKEANDFSFMVYPWHRSGSLNNDINRPSDAGTRSAVLSKKIISNLKFSTDNTWLPSAWDAESDSEGITPVQVFNSNEVSLIKIPTPKRSGITTINYYGNVDSLTTPQISYPAAYFSIKGESGTAFTDTGLYSVASYNTTAEDNIGDGSKALIKSTEPCRIKYKSSPHAVFAMNYSDRGGPWILPSVNSINAGESITTVPFWSKVGDSQVIVPSVYNTVTYYNTNGLNFIESPNTGEYAVVSEEVNGKLRERIYQYTSTGWQVVTDTEPYFKYENNGTEIWWKQVYGGSSFYAERQEFNTPDSYQVRRSNISIPDKCNYPYLFLAELYRDSVTNQFGGNSDEAYQNNMWIPASDSISLDEAVDGVLEVNVKYGDTWYSRYDCLKTYPFTHEDENQVVEIGSFMCETRVNIDGRYDRNRGQVSNLYMNPQNFNLLNEVYSQRNNFFNYRILDEDYYKQHIFSNQVTWSTEKIAASETDPWLNITLANVLDMDGSKGKVTSIDSINDTLLCFQEKALSQIMFNSRVQIQPSDGVPIEISNGYKVDGSRLISDSVGCQNKWSISSRANSGIFFIDNNTDSIWLYNGQLTNLSETMGLKWWVKENHSTSTWNPSSSDAIRTFYDPIYRDVYFTPGTKEFALCYSEQLNTFVSLMSYGGTQAMFSFADGFYSLKESENSICLYQNNVGDYNNFYGTPKGWNLSFISNDNPTITKIFDTIDLRTDHYETNDTEKLLNSCPINYIEVDNEYQHSGIVMLDNKNMRKKFRVWRGLIPRNKGTMQRIRNPWAMITLGWFPIITEDPEDNIEPPKDDVESPEESIEQPKETIELPREDNRKAVIHDISIKYTV